MSMVLNQPSNSSVLTLFQRLIVIVCAALVFAACTDGYPNEDELTINPLKLNQPQRLEAMNQLGQDAHPDLTWIYRALPSCILQMTVDGLDSGKQVFSLPMLNAGVDISSSKADPGYGVKVKPRDGANLSERVVFLSKTWVDAVAMSHLVRSFQTGCQTSAATVSINNTNPS